MPVLQSHIDPHDPLFHQRRKEMLSQIEHFRSLEQAVVSHSNKAAPKFKKRGQLLPRERVNLLLDPGMPFVELSTLAGYKMHDDDGKKQIAGGGNIIGIGYVSGTRVMVFASDSAIKGGSVSPMGLKKTLRAHEIALQNKLPIVNLVESGGANLLYQSEIFVDGGRSFCNMARLSAAGIPQITVVHGSSTAGGAYIPGLSDYVIVVKNRAKIFLAGAPLVKAAINETVEDDEELGGAQMHYEVTGTAEYIADDDAHGILLAREVVAQLGWNDDAKVSAPTDEKAPKYPVEELLGVVPVDFQQKYDVREVIARIVDGSDFLEFKAGFGSETVCGHARIQGYKCGIIGNNGPIFPQGANKATHFIQACCQSNTPIIYLHNISGYMVGLEAERAGIVKHGSKMIQAVANASVPQLSVLIGGSFGAGNYGMCGRAYDPRFIFAWPNSQVSVMGGAQAAKVIEIFTMAGMGRQLKSMKLTEAELEKIGQIWSAKRDQWPEMFAAAELPKTVSLKGLEFFAGLLAKQFSKMGIPIDLASPDGVLLQMTSFIRKRFDAESTSLFATARIWDDGIIDPRDTRRVLGFCLSVCKESEHRCLRPNQFGVARP